MVPRVLAQVSPPPPPSEVKYRMFCPMGTKICHVIPVDYLGSKAQYIVKYDVVDNTVVAEFHALFLLAIVSGFYAECPHKNMYVTGSLWTKSKFLGLSLGVHFIGNGEGAWEIPCQCDDPVLLCHIFCVFLYSQSTSAGLR